MSDIKTFYYIGDDEAYFKNLSTEFKRLGRVSVVFKKYFETDEKKIQSLFLKVFVDSPDCVLIDFSTHTQDYLHLSRILSRTPFKSKVLIVGLVDYLSPPEVLREGIATGVSLNHIKSAEYFDLVYDVLKIISPESSPEHGFATCELKEPSEAFSLARIGYVSPQGLHLESDLSFEVGEKIHVDNFLSKSKTIYSAQMTVTQVKEENLFYHWPKAIDLDFNFADDLNIDGIDQNLAMERKRERTDTILLAKKQIGKWIKEHAYDSQEKRIKILIIDKQFAIYRDQLRTDKHPFILRNLPFLTDITKNLIKVHPQIIAVNLDAKDDVTSINNLIEFVNTISFIKSKESIIEKPYILIFNCEETSAELQVKMQYANLLTFPDELKVDVLIKLATVASQKLKLKDSNKEHVFLSKKNPNALAEIRVPIQIEKISELDIVFSAHKNLPLNINLHLHQPVDCYVYLLEVKEVNKALEYYGVIHCVDEIHKKELRRYVNSVFFRDHDAEKAAELEEYQKLNQQKLDERAEQERLAREAQEAAQDPQAQENPVDQTEPKE